MKSKLLLISLLIIATSAINAQKLTHTYHFNAPSFGEKYDGFVEAQIEECLNLGTEGNPLMPQYSAEILLPQESQIKNINIVSIIYSENIQDINIIPAARPFPISMPAPADYKPTPNPDIYGSNITFPGNIISNSATQFLGGYAVGIFTMCPLEFHPDQRTAKYIKEITIEIEVEPATKKSYCNGNSNPITAQRVTNIVDNTKALREYSFPAAKGQEIDLLLITKADFVGPFETYIQFKTDHGFACEIKTVEDIYASYPGDDHQEKIRNCIKDYYENMGLIYVILGGDADASSSTSAIVPHRGFYVDNGGGTIDEDIPADMYYACLDGTWDNNNNGVFGEPGEEDLYAEVFIGRMCVGSATDIANMTNKLIKYQEEPVVADIEKALMVGEALDETTYGGDSKDDVAEGSSNYGYTTAGLPATFSVNRLYEKLGYWNKNDVFDEFNNVGCNLLNHLGHASVTYNMKMNTGDLTVSNFQNNGISRGFVIGYSQGCYNGSFDNRDSDGSYGSDCFSEKITNMPTAEVATIGNSRFGWYQSSSTNGASQYFDRQFYDAIFGENITQIGAANGDSKEDNAAYILNNGVIRWCAYELTLFGDPSMDIWTEQPAEIVADFPESLPIGINEITFNTDAPFARIGLMQENTLVGRGIADQSGDITLEFFDPIISIQPIHIFITAHNKFTFSSNINILTDQPAVIFDTFEINDETGNNNGMADYGETIQLGLSLKNVGFQPATNVVATLSSSDPYLTLSYLAVDFGNFEAGETITIPDAFELIIGNDVPDLHDIKIEVHAQGTGNWNSDFEITSWAPKLQITNVIIDDNAGGNGNGMLDPGENAILEFNVINQGHSISPELEMQIESLNENISVFTGSATHPSLAINEATSLSFDIHVSESAVSGDIAQIFTTLNSGEYLVNKTFNFDIGVTTETFESGDFGSLDWEFGGILPWQISTENPWEGNYCIRSGQINNNQSSEISIVVFILTPDTITFYRKVSSELDNDYLQFYIDNTMKSQWSGDVDWQPVSFQVPNGMHTLRWVYDKDQYASNGEDCAWIDFIKFPTLAQPSVSAGGDNDVCLGGTFMPNASGNFVQGVNWATSGDGTFNNTNMMKPTYTPGYQDKQNGEVVLTIMATGMNGGAVSDEMTLFIVTAPGIPGEPQGEIYACTNYGLTYEYTIEQVGITNEYLWELLPVEAGTISGNSTTASIVWTPDYNGTVQLHVKSLNACGGSGYSESLEILAEICTGIDEPEKDDFLVFPNPNNGTFTLSLPGKTENATITLFSAFGQQVMKTEYQNNSSSIEINVTRYPSGVYYLQIETKAGKFVRKVVKN